MESVRHIDYDAIAVLLAILVRFRGERVGFNGSMPSDQQANRRLYDSGFLRVLFGHTEREPEDPFRLSVGPLGHRFLTHAQRTVESALTARILEEAAQNIWQAPRRFQGVQRVLVELMQNTHNHASPLRPGEKHWWLSVSHRRAEKATSFVFVDLGVGVFGSLDTKPAESIWYGWRAKFFAVFKKADRSEILRLILDGELHRTVTGQPFRGKGLPGIKMMATQNWLSGLRIVTNDVYADVDNDDYRVLDYEFPGTLVAWNVTHDNRATS